MFSIMDLPLVPIIALLAIVPLIGWQTLSYFKNKAKNKTPNVPQITSNKHQDKPTGKNVKNVTLITNLKVRNKNTKKTSLVFSVTILLFVIANVVIVTFYLSNRKISYLPRAGQPVTPTVISNLNPLGTSPTITNVPSVTPATTLQPINTMIPMTTITPQATVKPSSTIIPTSTTIPKVTVIPTSTMTPKPTVLAPTAAPTLLAQNYTVPSKVPTYTPTPKPTVSPTAVPTAKPSVNPTVKPTVSHSPSISTTTIPVVGINKSSIFLGVFSLFFLVLGFLL